jgi:S-adenosylmethionine:tRNA ribosyltransferase-isomerase
VRLSEFDFELPEELIAQHPSRRRDESRMMVICRESGERHHLVFHDLPQVLDSSRFLVLNNTRVFPARLRARRPGRAEQIEVLLVRELRDREWIALVRPARKAKKGQDLHIADDLAARVIEERDDGSRVLRFEGEMALLPRFEQIGETPLPPYIRRRESEPRHSEDRERYQTVYARHTGSIAAPTAGLHFTPQTFERLSERGIAVCDVLLHVGYGTFQPVRTVRVESHRMESEYFELSQQAAAKIKRLKSEGKRLTAVGTTTTRVLEHVALTGEISERSGFCDLFIYPGFRFRAVDALLTNFHLPRSTLFMLVCAFGGIDLIHDCYEEAIAEDYRFFSYGDCMLIL